MMAWVAGIAGAYAVMFAAAWLIVMGINPKKWKGSEHDRDKGPY